MSLLEKDLQKLKGRDSADDLGASGPRAGHAQSEGEGRSRTGCRVRPKATLRPQRVPGTKRFPETEETELALRGQAEPREVSQAKDGRPEAEKPPLRGE